MGIGSRKRIGGFLALAVLGAAIWTAGGSGAASAAPSCGQTITEDTVLSDDLYCSGDGLIVSSDTSVTIDFNRHGVFGSGSGSGVSVISGDVMLTNGVVRGFQSGVLATNHTSLVKMRISGNESGVSGFRVDFSPGGLLLQDSAVSDNLDTGVTLAGINGSSLISNRILRNGGAGVSLGGHSDLTVMTGNEISRNTGPGVVDSQSFASFTNNKLAYNGGDGIVLSPDVGDGYSFTGNYTAHNDGLGIRAVFGVVDGGGNQAWANTDPRQCVYVVCSMPFR